MRRVYFILIALSAIVAGSVVIAGTSDDPIPFRRLTQSVLGETAPRGDGLSEDVRPDSLSKEEVLRRISRIYRTHAEALAAEAAGRQEAMEPLLQRSLAALQALSHQPGILEDRRFRELFRTVVTEYEKYFGLPADTLAVERGEIFELREQAFAALNDLEDPLLEDVEIASLRPGRGAVPMTVNRLVEQSIRYLLQQPDRHLNTWLRRADTYFPMIEQIFREEGVPDELKYLALIESGLNPKARSWAQAVGIWQFMAPTGREHGLQVNSWVDERMDPEASTRAAARYLHRLYDTFGDWHLALAAYNCGPGNVNRAVRRAGGEHPTFWSIYDHLPKETRNYVPMYIAAALVASNPTAFNVRAASPGPQYAYDTVPVRALTPLQTIADLAGTDVATIRALNPALRGASVPPGDATYQVRIPHGTHPTFTERYAALPQASRHVVLRRHVVRRGDTPRSLARRYGLSADALLAANAMPPDGRLRVGQRLNVPVPEKKATVKSAPLVAAVTPQSVFYGPRSRRPVTAGAVQLPTRAPEARPSPAPPPTALASVHPAPTAAPAPRQAPKTSTQVPVRQVASRVDYRVRRGDTLGRIASRHGVSVGSLRSWNGLRGTALQVGQRLTIHPGKEPPARHVAAQVKKPTARPHRPAAGTYRVRRGDTLYRISQRHGVSVASLKRANGLRSNQLSTGQRLRIPR